MPVIVPELPFSEKDVPELLFWCLFCLYLARHLLGTRSSKFRRSDVTPLVWNSENQGRVLGLAEVTVTNIHQR